MRKKGRRARGRETPHNTRTCRVVAQEPGQVARAQDRIDPEPAKHHARVGCRCKSSQAGRFLQSGQGQVPSEKEFPPPLMPGLSFMVVMKYGLYGQPL